MLLSQNTLPKLPSPPNVIVMFQYPVVVAVVVALVVVVIVVVAVPQSVDKQLSISQQIWHFVLLFGRT